MSERRKIKLRRKRPPGKTHPRLRPAPWSAEELARYLSVYRRKTRCAATLEMLCARAQHAEIRAVEAEKAAGEISHELAKLAVVAEALQAEGDETMRALDSEAAQHRLTKATLQTIERENVSMRAQLMALGLRQESVAAKKSKKKGKKRS